MITKLSTTHEISVLIPLVDLAQLLLKDRFNPNAKFQVNVTQENLHLVQFDRRENDSDPKPPSAIDPENVR